MKRRVVLHGPSSLSISLPSVWVKQFSVHKGDEVDVSQQGPSLVVNPPSDGKSVKTKEVSFVGLSDDTAKNLLYALHRRGYDEIKLHHDSSQIERMIHKFLHEMHFGYEIIKQTESYTTIRNVSIPEKNQFDNLVRRLFLITIEYAEKIYEILSSPDDEVTQTHLLHKASIDRIANFCQRIIAETAAELDTPFRFAVVVITTSIADELERLNKYALEKKPEDLEPFLKTTREVIDLFKRTYDLFYNFSLENYDDLLTASTQVIGALEDEMKKDTSNGHWFYLHYTYKRINDLSLHILSLYV
ncbi:MAG: hypothetical protein ACOC32_01770 [Nanoarchaeota archaeon]